MSLLLTKSFLLFRGVLAFWMALSFLGFSIAAYNPDFHAFLHAHETSQEDASHHTQCSHSLESNHEVEDFYHESDAAQKGVPAERDSHESDASCHLCNIHNHFATSVTPFFETSEFVRSSSKSLLQSRVDFYFLQSTHSISSRGPPAAF